ncbi:MAG: hypothetical protein GWP58_10070, partial [Gammaproteobacteria bacterium]|nr:hypothetical protein [Gammaproteobacteria bacterium]
MNFQQGNYIHHPRHGVGKVQSIRKRSFYGSGPATYAQLYFERDQLTLTLLEKDLPDIIRNVISTEDAFKLLDHI